MSFTVGSLELESPLINAGGLVKTPEDARRMAATAVGAVLGGSFTLDARPGNGPNSEVVYYVDESRGITYNSIGMPNRSLEESAPLIKEMALIAHDFGKPFILNLAPTSSNPAEEVKSMAAILDRYMVYNIDAIELNASCPNVVVDGGGRHEILSHHPDQLGDLLDEFNEIRQDIPFGDMWVRISPFRSYYEASPLTKVLREADVDVVSAFNTFPGGKPLDKNGSEMLQVPGGVGGMSGRGMEMQALTQTDWLVEARDKQDADFDIVGSNGIHDGASLFRRLRVGASAVSVTTVLWESENWGRTVNDLLTDFYDQL